MSNVDLDDDESRVGGDSGFCPDAFWLLFFPAGILMIRMVISPGLTNGHPFAPSCDPSIPDLGEVPGRMDTSNPSTPPHQIRLNPFGLTTHDSDKAYRPTYTE